MHFPRLWMLAACGCLIASALVFRAATPYANLWLAVLLLGLGCVLVGLALRGITFDLLLVVARVKNSSVNHMTALHWVMAVSGMILLALLAAINGGLLKDAASTDAQFGLLVTSLLSLVVGFGAVHLRPIRVDWLAVMIVTGLTLIALLLRLWQLNQTVRFFVDELSYSTAIEMMWARPTVELLAPMEGTAAFPNLFAYFEAKTVSVLGRNLAGLRAASALTGALSIPALYLLARALFQQRVALVAAALLVTFPPHLHLSRLGIIEVTGALAGLIALAFLLRGLMHNRRLDFAAGGMLLGLTHYFHEGARILFTPLALVMFVLLMFIWRVPERRRNLLLAGGLAFIVALPIYTTLAALQFSAAARFSTPHISLGGDYWRELLASGDFYWHIRWHIIDPLLLFVHQPDRGLFYAGHTPMLLEYMVPAFLLGVCIILWRWRWPAGLLLLMWLLAVILGNTLLMQSTIMTRYVVVFPAVIMLVSVGLWGAFDATFSRPAAVFLVLVTVVAFSVGQARYYFDWHVPLYNVQFRRDWGHLDAQDAVLRSLNFPAGTQIYIVSRIEPDSYHTRGLLTFHRHDLGLTLLRPEQVNADFLYDLRRNIDYAFFIEPNEPALVERLREYLGVGEPVFSPYNLPSSDQFALYYAPALPQL